MKNRTTTTALALALLACVSPADGDHAGLKVRRAPEGLAGDEARTVELYRKVLPSVVTILTQSRVVSPLGLSRQGGLGTGVLISPDCHVLTAAHVVDGADAIVVKTQDGAFRRSELIFSEPDADVALLRLVEPDAGLPHAELGDSDRLAVGQSTYIIGNPRGLENSLSVGHISGFREFNRLYDGTVLAEFIQTDAAINSGNSGGPVFDSQGRVIGIASWILSHSGGSEGLGFVVAINTARQLLALEDRAWTGMEAVYLNAEQLGALLNLDAEGGLLVQQVARNSPADRAGIRGGSVPAQVGGATILLGGDLILELGGREACHAECLVAAHDHIATLDRIPVTLLRGGKRLDVTVDVSSTRRSFLQRTEESASEGPRPSTR